MREKSLLIIIPFLLLLLTGCERRASIVTNIDEKEANMIVVLLESKGISAEKMLAASGGVGGGQQDGQRFSISVKQGQSVDAMAVLNKNGLPKKKPITLLELFSRQGLMTTEKEERIKFHAGLAEEIAGTIRMVDGVIDSRIQLSFPEASTGPGGEESGEKKSIKASVYVKHQGIIDDPNTHLEDKIKRLVAGSITGLDMQNVTIVSDRSRFADLTIDQIQEGLSQAADEYVSIWSIVMSRESAATFRTLFFFLTLLLVIFAVVAGWLIWKLYPILRKGKHGLKQLISPAPLDFSSSEPEEAPEE